MIVVLLAGKNYTITTHKNKHTHACIHRYMDTVLKHMKARNRKECSKAKNNQYDKPFSAEFIMYK